MNDKFIFKDFHIKKYFSRCTKDSAEKWMTLTMRFWKKANKLKPQFPILFYFFRFPFFCIAVFKTNDFTISSLYFYSAALTFTAGNDAVLHSFQCFQCLPFTLLPHHLLLTQKEHFLRLWSRTTSIQLVAFSFFFFFGLRSCSRKNSINIVNAKLCKFRCTLSKQVSFSSAR